MPNASERVAASKKLRKTRTTPKIRQRELDRAEVTIEAAYARAEANGRDKVEVDEATGVATMYKLWPRRTETGIDIAPQEAAIEAVEWYEARGWVDVSVTSRDESGRYFRFVMSGTPPESEDEILPMRDHDGTIIYMKVQNRYESELGPAVRGLAFSNQACLNKQYLGHRILPLSMVFDATAEAAEKAQKRSSSRAARKPGGGHCHHCGEPTRGGRFIPGHDAKLKGDLIREGTKEAQVERIIRGWTAPPDKVTPVLAKLIERGDEFIRERVVARTGLSESELF